MEVILLGGPGIHIQSCQAALSQREIGVSVIHIANDQIQQIIDMENDKLLINAMPCKLNTELTIECSDVHTPILAYEIMEVNPSMLHLKLELPKLMHNPDVIYLTKDNINPKHWDRKNLHRNKFNNKRNKK